MAKTNRIQPSDLLRRAYSPQEFQNQTADIGERLARHLSAAQSRSLPVFPGLSPEETLGQMRELLEGGDSGRFVEGVLERVHQLHHPRFFCAQVSPSLPLAALAEGMVALLSNSSAVYEMGPASAALETLALEWIAQRVGFDTRHSAGVLTNGGSAGNLTALLAARQAKAEYDVWKEGPRADRRFTVLVSEQAHYCVRRSVQIMGWGEAGATAVETDRDYRITAPFLRGALGRARANGLIPLAVCASACTTSTGSYDPLMVVADFCQEHGLWMHVDGAHGVAATLSPRYRDRLEGLNRADSVVVDFHKMMLMPLTTTAVLYRRASDSYQAFDQQASYLFGDDNDKPWFQGGMRTLECSKRNMGLAFWLTLQTYGEELFRDYVEHTHDLARAFAQLVRDNPHFELAVTPQSNIVCFRLRGSGDRDLRQARLRELVNRSGCASLGTTRLRDGVYLRAVFMNPLSSLEDAQALLQTIAETAAQVDSPPPPG
jgi:L-2,4-diaminobutyrate decarboxylase